MTNKPQSSPLEPPIPNKVGRPSTFRQEYCAVIQALASEGKSQAQWAKELGVAISTMKIWRQKYPKFRAAYGVALDLELAWWQEQARQSLKDKTFNAALWRWAMVFRFPDLLKASQDSEALKDAADLERRLSELLTKLKNKGGPAKAIEPPGRLATVTALKPLETADLEHS